MPAPWPAGTSGRWPPPARSRRSTTRASCACGCSTSPGASPPSATMATSSSSSSLPAGATRCRRRATTWPAEMALAGAVARRHIRPMLARSALRHVVDFALPPRCPGCGAVTSDPHSFCLECWSKLAFLGDPCCARCGLPFDYGRGEESLCGQCLADPPPFDRLRAAVAYGEVARTVALKLKYGGRPGVAATLARSMTRHAPAADPDAVIVPVPLHRWRIWKRGYNQAALIAWALAKRTGLAAEL